MRMTAVALSSRIPHPASRAPHPSPASPMQTDLLLLLRLIAAALCAGALGWERERAGKSAGLRTHMLVGIGAALFVALTETVIADVTSQGPGVVVRPDPLRAVDAVATGIGFLGGGLIFVSDKSERVRGLTTAASVW